MQIEKAEAYPLSTLLAASLPVREGDAAAWPSSLGFDVGIALRDAQSCVVNEGVVRFPAVLERKWIIVCLCCWVATDMLPEEAQHGLVVDLLAFDGLTRTGFARRCFSDFPLLSFIMHQVKNAQIIGGFLSSRLFFCRWLLQKHRYSN